MLGKLSRAGSIRIVYEILDKISYEIESGLITDPKLAIQKAKELVEKEFSEPTEEEKNKANYRFMNVHTIPGKDNPYD